MTKKSKHPADGPEQEITSETPEFAEQLAEPTSEPATKSGDTPKETTPSHEPQLVEDDAESEPELQSEPDEDESEDEPEEEAARTAEGAREAPKLERLQKILAQAGVASRRHAEELITGGHVQVNGQTVTTLGSKADAQRDHIRVDGKLLHGAERLRYFVLNKPKGYVTTVSDPEGRPTVMGFFAKTGERVYPVGRLDYQSEGLLLVTNDGELANKLTKAASGVEKTYLVKVSGQPAEGQIERLREGVSIERGKLGEGKVHTAPAQIRQVRKGENPWYEVVLIEGRNRELRKMFEEIGHHVEKIRRVGYGPLVLDVEPGKLRELDAAEVQALRLTAEGKMKPRRPKIVLPKDAGKTVSFEKNKRRIGGQSSPRRPSTGEGGGDRREGYSRGRSSFPTKGPAGDRDRVFERDQRSRPAGDRPFRPAGDRPPRPSGDRPFKPAGERTFRAGGDRQDRSGRDFQERGFQGRNSRGRGPQGGDTGRGSYAGRGGDTFGSRRPSGPRPSRLGPSGLGSDRPPVDRREAGEGRGGFPRGPRDTQRPFRSERPGRGTSTGASGRPSAKPRFAKSGFKKPDFKKPRFEKPGFAKPEFTEEPTEKFTLSITPEPRTPASDRPARGGDRERPQRKPFGDRDQRYGQRPGKPAARGDKHADRPRSGGGSTGKGGLDRGSSSQRGPGSSFERPRPGAGSRKPTGSFVRRETGERPSGGSQRPSGGSFTRGGKPAGGGRGPSSRSSGGSSYRGKPGGGKSGGGPKRSGTRPGTRSGGKGGFGRKPKK
jgi:23S rRNA pseudouridine2605 synthase